MSSRAGLPGDFRRRRACRNKVRSNPQGRDAGRTTVPEQWLSPRVSEALPWKGASTNGFIGMIF